MGAALPVANENGPLSDVAWNGEHGQAVCTSLLRAMKSLSLLAKPRAYRNAAAYDSLAWSAWCARFLRSMCSSGAGELR